MTGIPGSYMRKTRQATARRVEFVGRRFRFIHPFHPLRGREFELVDYRQSWGEDWLFFHDDTGRLISIRAGWTDVGDVDPFVEVAAGRAHFRVADLVRLVGLIEGLGA